MAASEDDTFRRLCDCSVHNDSSGVAKLLGHRRSVSLSLDEPLLNSSPQANDIRRILLGFALNEEGPVESARPEALFRAVLISPSAYELPWEVTCDFVTYLHSSGSSKLSASSNRSFLWSSIADIQSFLQQSVAVWWEEERKQTAGNTTIRTVRAGPGETLSSQNPKYWIQKLAATVMDPLMAKEGILDSQQKTQHRMASNDHWTVPLELVSTIVSLSYDLDASLFHSTMDQVFRQPIRPDRLLSWVNLASELRLFLRDDDWSYIQGTTMKALSTSPSTISHQDLPGLAEAILSLSTAVMRHPNNEADDLVPWQELTLQLLNVASVDMSTLSTVETILQSSLSALPSAALQQWTTTLSKVTTNIDTYVQTNMFLLILRASRQSGSQLVSELLAQALGESGGSFDLTGMCWDGLISLALPEQKENNRTNCRVSSLAVKDMKEFMQGVTYKGEGNFAKEGTDTAMLTKAGSIVYRSLFLSSSQTAQPKQHLLAMDRAQAWVHAASDVLESRRGSDEPYSMVLALVILITVYCEIPVTRSSLTCMMFQNLSGEGNFSQSAEDLAALHCLVISVVLKTLQNGPSIDRQTGDLDQVVDILARSLPSSLFFDLSDAMHLLPSARHALLSTAREKLDSTIDVWWATEASSRGAKESNDRIKCGLYALCVLIASEQWQECEADAWKMLSDIIVDCKPSLPVPVRSWLFERLKEFAEEGRFSASVLMHLLRACLVRLLSFFGLDKNAKGRFLAEKVEIVWKDDKESPSLSSRKKQVEDVRALLDLVLTLLYSLVKEDGDQETKAAVASYRFDMIKTILSGHDCAELPKDEGRSFVARLQEAELDGIGLCCTATLYCLVNLMQYALGLDSTDGWVAAPSPEKLKEMLVSEECQSLSYKNYSPCWLQAPKHVIGCSTAFSLPERIHQSIPLRLSLCDTIAEFLAGQRCSFSDEAHSDSIKVNGSPMKQTAMGLKPKTCQIAMALSAVFAARRKLEVELPCELGIRAVYLEKPKRLYGLLESFCSVSLPILRRLGADGIQLAEVDEMTLAILDILSLVSCSTDNATAHDENILSRLLSGVFRVYSVLCEEKSAVRLIAYLESQSSLEGNDRLEHDEARSFSLQKLFTSKDVDAAIRQIRLLVLRAALNCLTNLARLSSGHHFGKTVSTQTTAVPRIELSIIDTLSRDLNVGLDGASGGVSGDMLLAFVGCIDVSADILLEAKMPLNNDDQRRYVIGLCETAAVSLQNILCSYALKGASAFKKIMMLSLHKLPAIARMVDRSWLLDSLGGDSVSLDWNMSIVLSPFQQCMALLERPNDGSIFADHDVLDASEEESDGSSTAARSVVQKNGDLRPSGLQFGSERVWTWAFCCVFDTIEQFFAESQKLMQQTVLFSGSGESSLSYFTRRRTEITSMMKMISNLFEDRVDEDKRTQESKVIEGLLSLNAVRLPAAAKLKLCAVLDRLLVILLRATKCIASRLKSSPHVGSSYLAFVEAFSCITGWMDSKTDTSEFTIGTRKWYAAEKHGASFAHSKKGVFIPEASILRKLPKIICRLEEFETAIQKLGDTLRDTGQTGKKKARMHAVLREFDHFVSASGVGEDETAHFAQMLSSKTTSLEKQRLKLSAQFDGTSFEEILSIRSKKRKAAEEISRRVQKERRRPAVRSRNQVVDEWLQKDREIGEGEAFDDDAYADLEDFLVEG